jgi:hypothetical protein
MFRAPQEITMPLNDDVTAFAVVATRGTNIQQTDRFYAKFEDAAFDAGVLAAKAATNPYYVNSREGVPVYTVEEVCTSPHWLRYAPQFNEEKTMSGKIEELAAKLRNAVVEERRQMAEMTLLEAKITIAKLEHSADLEALQAARDAVTQVRWLPARIEARAAAKELCLLLDLDRNALFAIEDALKEISDENKKGAAQ